MGKTSLGQKLFAWLFDPYIDHALKIHEEQNRRIDFTTRKLYTDEMTQANNNKFYTDKLLPLLDKRESVCAASLDIDKFKSFNDTYGHSVGDLVLKKVAHISQEIIGRNFARKGGEEFVFMLEENKQKTALIAERLREEIEMRAKKEVNKENNMTIDRNITISIGVAENSEINRSDYPHSDGFFKAVFDLADARLYEAKETGRNKVVFEGKGMINQKKLEVNKGGV
jgi:diguanylate cyclase (GGDEF)-like protein